MNFDLGNIFTTLSGFFQGALGWTFTQGGLSSETGNGILNFFRAFDMFIAFLGNLFTKLFSGLAK